jgi:acyl carrier protein
MQIMELISEVKPDEMMLQRWLIDRVAESIKVKPDDIDTTLPFSYYGLDSVAAIGLSGDLEILLGTKLSPTLTWDYPTIELLAAYLAKE